MKKNPILETVISRWQTLNLRERRMVMGMLLFVGIAVIWFVLFEPAWVGRERLREELPQLRSQVAKLESLSAEAKTLAQIRTNSKAQSVVRAELQRSLSAAGLDSNASVDAGSDVIKVKFDDVTLDALLTWLYGAARDTRVRVVDAKLTRDVAPGRVAAILSLESPGSGG